MIHTLVAEHVHLLRIGLVAYLTQEPGIEVVAELEKADRLVSTAAELKPRVAVIDVELPPEGGSAVAGLLARTLPACATVMLVGRDDPGHLSRAMPVRPLGLISREAPVELLTWCVRRVASGRRVVDPDLARTARTIDENPLTHRERQILRIASMRRLDGGDRRRTVGQRQDGAQPPVPRLRTDRRAQPDGRHPHRDRARVALRRREVSGGSATSESVRRRASAAGRRRAGASRTAAGGVRRGW